MANPPKSPSHRTFSFATSCTKIVALLFIGLFLSTNVGCGKLIANVTYLIWGRDDPAEFNEFKGKRIAVVVSTEAGYNSDASAIVLARMVSQKLGNEVKKIKLVDAEEVDRVFHDQPANNVELGKMVDQLSADYLLAIDMRKLKLKYGPTLYQGTCDCSLAVYKAGEGNKPVFRKELPEYVFPSGGVPSTEYDESTFRGIYLSMLTSRISRCFHPYDATMDVGEATRAHSFGRF